MGLVTPAVLPSSRKDLEEKLALFARFPGVRRIQIDVVDGKFTAPASWPYSAEATKGTPYSAEATKGTPYSAEATKGTPYSAEATKGTPYTAPKELREMVQKDEMLPRLDCIEYEIDLMCLDAEDAAALWLALGATRIIFHAESTIDLPRFLASARNRFGAGDGFAPGLISYGLAINIASDSALLEPCLGEIQFVQFMGIAKIGQQGQAFDGRVVKKIREFKAKHPDVPVQVDGGVTLASASELLALNVNNLVVGSGILKAADPLKAFTAFEALENSYGV
ncbi:MAG: hypothetical protein PHV99_01850 [Candidatus Pacebacteria bacterium]|nr:hypothetical protein [Candidatus Paceibacterota bacterium]